MFGRLRPPARPRSPRPRPLRTRLWVEPLEDRTLLSVSLAGTIFNDLNANHAFDAGEPGVAAATAFIDVNQNGVLDQNADFNLSGPTSFANSVPSAVTTVLPANAVSNPLSVDGIAGAISNFQVHLSAQLAAGGGTVLISLISPQGLIDLNIPDLVLLKATNTTAASFNGTVSDATASGQSAALTGANTGSIRPTTDTADLGSSEALNNLSRASDGKLSGIYNGNSAGGWQLAFTSLTGNNVNGLTLNSWSIEFTGSEQTAVADSAGNYSFSGLPAGPVAVAVANAPAGNPDTTVVIPASGQATANLGIQPTFDLVGTAFSVTGDGINWGGSATVNYTVTNQGPGNAPASGAEIRLSNDVVIDGSDTLLLPAVSIPALAAGASFSGSILVQLPQGSGGPGTAPAGFGSLDQSYLGLRVNPGNTIGETNTANNANQGRGLDLAPVVPFGNLDVTGADGAQQQPALAVDPADPKHLVMAYMDYRPTGPHQTADGYASIGVVTSHDGGLTWSPEKILQTPAAFSGGAGKLAMGYPVVRFDNTGQAYIAFMAAMFFGNTPPVIFPDGSSRATVTVTNPDGTSGSQSVLTRSFGMQATNGIFVVSSAGGDDWSAMPLPVEPTQVYAGNGIPNLKQSTPQNPTPDVPFDALPDLAIDPNSGNLYVTFTRLSPAGKYPSPAGTTHTGGEDVWTYVYDSHSQTWKPTNQTGQTPPTTPAISFNRTDGLEAGAFGTNGQASSKITVDSTGAIYVSFMSASRFLVERSTDGGAHFSFLEQTNNQLLDPFPVGAVAPSYNAPVGPFYNLPSRDVVADPTRPGSVYVVDAVQVKNGAIAIDPADLNFSRSEDGGATWQSYFTVGGSAGNISSYGTLSSASDQEAYRTPLNDDDANRYTRSFFSTTTEVFSQQATPQMVVDNQGNIIVVWMDTRRDPDSVGIDVYAAVSRDGGLTFSPNFLVTQKTFYPGDGAFTDGQGASDTYLGQMLGLAAAGGMVYVAWTATVPGTSGHPGNQDVFFSRFALAALPLPQTDRFEPNDTPDTPTALGPVTVQRVFPNLVASPGNADYYLLTLPGTSTLNVGVNGGPDLALKILDNSAAHSLVASGTALRDGTGQVIGSQAVVTLSGGQYLVEVTGDGPGGTATPYSMTAQALTADFGTQVYGTSPPNSQLRTAPDQNIFSLTAAVAGSVNVQLQAQGTTGPLALTILSGDGLTVLGTAQTSGTGDAGGVTQLAVPVQQGQRLLIQVSQLNEQLTITVPRTVTKVQFKFNGAASSTLTYSSSTTAAQVQNALNTITINGNTVLASNTVVTGPNGGPYVVTFINQLASQPESLSASVAGGTGTITVSETTHGGGTGNYLLAYTNLDQLETPLQTSVFYPTAGDPAALAVGQFTSDSYPDVVSVSTAQANPVSVLLNDGTGLLGAPLTFDGGTGGSLLPGGNLRWVTARDFDGDGIPDIAMTNYASNDVTVLLGRGDGTFGSDHRSDALPFPGRLTPADFSGDGILDLVVFPGATASTQSPQIAILTGRGDGTFLPPVLLQTDLPPGTTYGVVGDFNGDGKPDIAVFSVNGTGFDVFVNDGSGNFGARITNFLPEKSTTAVAADLNGDGRDDLVTGWTTSGNLYVLTSNGDGTFTTGTPYLANSDPKKLSSVLIGLIVTDAGGANGLGLPDGKKDVIAVVKPVVGNGAIQLNFLAGLGASNGSFLGFSPVRQLATGLFTGPVAVADLNQDGYPDVIAAVSGGVQVIYNQPLTGTANKTFQTARDLGTVVHLLNPTDALSPTVTDAYYQITAPSEVVSGAGAEVVDISALFQNLVGHGLSLQLLDANGNPLVVRDQSHPDGQIVQEYTAADGSGQRYRVDVPQGTVLYLHVFANSGISAGAYTLDIDTLPQAVSASAPPLFPGQNGQSGGPVSSIVLTFQGDRLDQESAETVGNYTVTWAGPDGQFGTADDQVIPIASPNGGEPIVYDASANTSPSSGHTYPTAVQQTVTLYFANPLPSGSYRITIDPAVQAAAFSSTEAKLLVPAPGFTGHPVVSLTGGQFGEGGTLTATDLVVNDSFDTNYAAFAQGTPFLTQFHDNAGSVLNDALQTLGDTSAVTSNLNAQAIAGLAPVAGNVPVMVIWLDPVSIDLADSQGARTTYNLQSNTVANNLTHMFMQTGGNIEVMVLAGVTGTYTLNLSDVQSTARGGVVMLNGGQVESVALTDAIRGGSRTFELTLGDNTAPAGVSPVGVPGNAPATDTTGTQVATNSGTTNSPPSAPASPPVEVTLTGPEGQPSNTPAGNAPTAGTTVAAAPPTSAAAEGGGAGVSLGNAPVVSAMLVLTVVLQNGNLLTINVQPGANGTFLLDADGAQVTVGSAVAAAGVGGQNDSQAPNAPNPSNPVQPAVNPQQQAALLQVINQIAGASVVAVGASNPMLVNVLQALLRAIRLSQAPVRPAGPAAVPAGPAPAPVGAGAFWGNPDAQGPWAATWDDDLAEVWLTDEQPTGLASLMGLGVLTAGLCRPWWGEARDDERRRHGLPA